MNAISPTASLQAPDLPMTDIRVLERLIALSMQLADLAFRQAHQEDKATDEKAESPEQPAKQPRRPGRADSRQIFLRLRRAIMETIAFKNRLIAGLLLEEAHARRKAAPRPTPEPLSAPAERSPEDPRRPHIVRYVRQVIGIAQKRRKTPITLQEVDTQIDAELAKDPNRRLQGRQIVLNLCKSLDIPFHANLMSRELFRPTPPAPD